MAAKRILLVDDDQDTRYVLKAILERQRVVVTEASDGFEAVQEARRQKPDLVIMDVRMPGMDGIEACRAFKTDPGLGDVPILILSGEIRRARLDELVELDRLPLYDDFLAKPFEYAELLALVKQRLHLN